MSKKFSLGLSALVLVLMASAPAQEPLSTQAPLSEAMSGAVTAQSMVMAPTDGDHFMGTITSISAPNVSVVTVDGTNATVISDANTIFLKDDNSVGLFDLRLGDSVQVFFEKTASGTLLATKIIVLD